MTTLTETQTITAQQAVKVVRIPLKKRDLCFRWKNVISCFMLCFVPVMAVIIFITTMFEFALDLFRKSALGVAISRESNRVMRAVATVMMKDPRNSHTLFVYFGITMIVPPLFLYCLWFELNNTSGFSLSLALCYHCVRNGPMFVFFAYVATLTHMEAHDVNGFFKPRYSFMNNYMGYFLSFFYGHVPENYRVGHNKIHHALPVNGSHDVTTTRGYQRDSKVSFFDYMSTFFFYWTGVSVVHHFFVLDPHKQYSLGWRQLRGMLVYYAAMLTFFYLHPKFAFVYVFFPWIESMNYLSAINYVWHSFVEPGAPPNEYIDSVTIVEGLYNVYNSDYHVVHHHNPVLQYLDMPAHYEKHRDEYIRHNATIFAKTHEFELFFWIILGRHDLLVKHWVDLSGKLSDEEKLTIILRRLGNCS